MELVIEELPKATIVSVAHRAELEAFHSRKIVLERRKGGAKLVSDIDLIPRKGEPSPARPLPAPSQSCQEGGVVSSSSPNDVRDLSIRHCERSEAIHLSTCRDYRLLRLARNDVDRPRRT